MSDVTVDRGDEADPADTHLLGALAGALGVDPVPDGLLERANALVEVLDLDSDLAELLATEGAELAGARGATDLLDTLTFELADASVTVELEVAEPGADIAGLLTVDAEQAVAGVRIELADPAGAIRAAGVADDLGAFVLTAPPGGPVSGPVRLLIYVRGARPVATDWFLLGPRRTS